MSFIEDLYYGNIDAQAYSPEFGAELKKKLNDLTELEKQISDKLTGDEKALFLKYTDKYIEFTSRILTDAFVSGFRLGANFAHDTFR
ncbi:MAG: hypothetical protein IJE48_07715 [Clostridia bacterium]|nr:hypothetical protein [Clostridia bacterium]